jgi:hypothetical protein
MPGRLGPRFALEAGFLIVLAVLAGFADLSWPLVVLVMGLGWGLATVVEVARWKEGPPLPAPVPRSYIAGPEPVDDVTRVILREEVDAAAPPRELADDLRPAPRPRHVRVVAHEDEGKD